VVFRHLAVIGEDSIQAAQASECAADQGRFWEYADRIFERPAGRNADTLSKDSLKRYAGQAGLDQAAFNTCLDGQQHRGRVQAETQAGRAKGVTSVPTVFINGRLIPNAMEVNAELRAMLGSAR
jgi:protein-disulfide isomerase